MVTKSCNFGIFTDNSLQILATHTLCSKVAQSVLVSGRILQPVNLSGHAPTQKNANALSE